MAKKTTNNNEITNLKELAEACTNPVDSVATAAAEMPESANIDNAAKVDAASVDNASIIDVAQIDYKKLKMRSLPKGITLNNASIIIGAVKAVLSGNPNNTEKSFFAGFDVEAYRAYMGDNNYQNAAQYCIIHNYNGKNRCFAAFSYILDQPFNFICTMHATKLLPELQADKKLSGNQLYGYNDRITKAMRTATEDKKSLIGTLSFNHLVEKGFGIDCAFISRADCNWAKKNIPALYDFNENFDVDKLPDNTINIDYRDIKALFDYCVYLRGIIKDSDKEYNQNQKDAAQMILSKIGA